MTGRPLDSAAEHRADQQRLRPGVGAVVHAAKDRARVEQHDHQCRGTDDERRRTSGRRGSTDASELEQDQEHERPQQVPLLLDREGPGVRERRGRPEQSEVRRAVERRIASSTRRAASRSRRRGSARSSVGWPIPRRRPPPPSSTTRARAAAPGPARPEPPEIDPAGRAVLGHEERRDQEAAQHEEDVDAQEPARAPMTRLRVGITATTATRGARRGPVGIRGRERSVRRARWHVSNQAGCRATRAPHA